MRLTGKLLLCAALLLPAGDALSQPASTTPTRRPDAREIVPDALLGTWKADVRVSSYSGQAPREHLRTFSYTAEGKLMESFLTLSATGEQSTGHWAVMLNGEPGPEYHSRNGSTSFAQVSLAQVDPTTFNVTETYRGAPMATGVYRLSQDGQGLTLTRTAANGSRSTTVYRRWQ